MSLFRQLASVAAIEGRPTHDPLDPDFGKQKRALEQAIAFEVDAPVREKRRAEKRRKRK